MPEFDLIRHIHAHAGAARADVALGMGDDGAVLSVPTSRKLVAVTDSLVEGVHFPAGTAPADIGWKALAVNLSDLAAMSATPAWVLLNLALPDAEDGFVRGFMQGFEALARRHDVSLVGGDTCRGPLCITVTALGFASAADIPQRSAARIGDRVCVTGTLGDAAAGLASLADPGDVSSGALEYLRGRLTRPTPRVAAGLALRGVAHACVDVSDGLVADLGHVAAASGVGIEIDVDALPLSPALCAAVTPERARELALTGGDDYELAFTMAADVVPAGIAETDVEFTCVGRVVAGSGVKLLSRDGEMALVRSGWEHFG